MIPTFQAACKSRATRLGVPPSPDELAAFDQSENLTSMHFKQLYSVLGLPLVQNKKKKVESKSQICLYEKVTSAHV